MPSLTAACGRVVQQFPLMVESSHSPRFILTLAAVCVLFSYSNRISGWTDSFQSQRRAGKLTDYSNSHLVRIKRAGELRGN